jgi:sec-independent protein translocase protein TatC
MTQQDIDSTKAPLLEHLVELRARLIKALIAFMVMFFVCFAMAKPIYNILIYPYVIAAGGPEHVKLIYTAPLEYLFTQIKIAVFGAAFFSFPIMATQIYKFVAPGLYKNERDAFLPHLIATPVLFLVGAAVVFFIAMPIVMRFSIGQQQLGVEGQAAIELLPKVSEYLSLIMTLIFAFGIAIQLPVILTKLAQVGIVDSAYLVKKIGRAHV